MYSEEVMNLGEHCPDPWTQVEVSLLRAHGFLDGIVRRFRIEGRINRFGRKQWERCGKATSLALRNLVCVSVSVAC